MNSEKLSEWPKVTQLINADQGLQLSAMFFQWRGHSLPGDDLPQPEPCFFALKKKKKRGLAEGWKISPKASPYLHFWPSLF